MDAWYINSKQEETRKDLKRWMGKKTEILYLGTGKQNIRKRAEKDIVRVMSSCRQLYTW